MSSREPRAAPLEKSSSEIGVLDAGTPGAESKDVLFTEGDAANPHNWSPIRRWLTVLSVTSMVMINILATNIITPAAPEILDYFHERNDIYRTLVVSIWDLGEGIGSLFAAPLSEMYGRSWVFHIGNLLGLVCTISGALSRNISMLIAFRFLGGFFLTAPTLAPAIIGDVIRQEERGVAMSVGIGLRSTAALAAPIWGAYLNEAMGWRWTIWVLAIVMGVFVAFSLGIVRETYAVTILEGKTARLRTGGADKQGGKLESSGSITKVLKHFLRPLQLIFESPTIVLVILYVGLAVGTQKTIITQLTTVMMETYGFSTGAVGLTFIGPWLGQILGVLFYGLTSDRYIKYRKGKDDGVLRAEHRLVHMVLGAFIFPAGLLIFGWTAAYHIFYVVPLVGTSLTGLSTVLATLPADSYLVDAYGRYSASAIAARTVVQFVFAASFPLAGPPLYDHLGLGWGNSLLGFLLAGCIPVLVSLARVKPQG